MPGTPFNSGIPQYVPVAVANIANVNPAANTYRLVRHIHLANTNAASRTITLYMGLTGGSAGGTEIVKGKTIAANDLLDIYFPSGLKFTTADFLTGVSSVDGTSITIEVTGEIYAS